MLTDEEHMWDTLQPLSVFVCVEPLSSASFPLSTLPTALNSSFICFILFMATVNVPSGGYKCAAQLTEHMANSICLIDFQVINHPVWWASPPQSVPWGKKNGSGFVTSIALYDFKYTDVITYYCNQLNILRHIQKSLLSSFPFSPSWELHLQHPATSVLTVHLLCVSKLSQSMLSYFVTNNFIIS